MKLSRFACILIALMWSSRSSGQAGVLDSLFGGGDGLVTTSFFTNHTSEGFTVATQEDGKIVVAGIDENISHFSSVVVTRYALDGTLDPSFNGSGKLVVQLQNRQGYLRSMVIQPDQKILLFFGYSNADSTGIMLHRLLPDGSPDITFHGSGFVSHTFMAAYTGGYDIVLQPDGKIIVCGYYGFVNDADNYLFVMRFKEDGTLDPSFGTNGLFAKQIGQSYSNLYDIELQQDLKIVGGGYSYFNGNGQFLAMRLTTNGKLDDSYSEDGIAFAPLSDQEDRAYSLKIQSDGKAVLAGSAYDNFTSATSFALARFTEDGELDPTFHGDGMNIYTSSGYADRANTLVIQPDGKIVMGGYVHSNVTGSADMAILRVLPNGILDPAWSGDGIADFPDNLETSTSINDLSIQADGLLVGTGFIQRDGLNSILVARFVSGIMTSVKDLHDVMPVNSLGCSPNPFSGQINVSYTLTAATSVQITMRSPDGKIIQVLKPGTPKAPGTYVEQLLTPAHLADGTYLISLETPEGIQSVRVLKIQG